MQNIISIQRSFSDQYCQELESQIRFLNQKVRNLEQHIEQLSQLSITIPMINGNQVIMIDQIVYCQASSNYCVIILKDGSRICASKTLKHIESLLPNRKFLRIHQSYLVNVKYIKAYNFGSKPQVQLSISKALPISKTGSKRMQDLLPNEQSTCNSAMRKGVKSPYLVKVTRN